MWMLSLEPMATASVDLSVEYESGRVASRRRLSDDLVRQRAGDEERRTRTRAPRVLLQPRELEHDLQPMARSVVCGSADHDDRHAAWELSVCGHSLVQHAVRTRRHHHGVRDALAESGRGARRARRFSRRRRPRLPTMRAMRKPGKILHEMRGGEMAALGEVPFGRYYGSCDVTPLFVMLADAYYRRTGDLAFIDEIWPQPGARARVDAHERRSRWRRLHRVRAPVRHRPGPAGVEGLARFGVSRRRIAR